MASISDNQFIKGILDHNPVIIDQIYRDFFPMVRKMVISNGGDTQQAKDVFQDAVIILYRKLLAGELELSCKLSTYLYAITKKLWMQEIKLKRRLVTGIEKMADLAEEPDETDEYRNSLKKILTKHFDQLSDDCQKILRMHFNSATIDEIQLIMGYKTRHHTIDRKYRCKRSLIKRILNDPTFKSIKYEYTGENRFIY